MPLKRTEIDPYRNFLFRVVIDGIIQAGFMECSGFDSTTDVIEYREGDEITTPRKGPGLTKYGDLTLKWGLTDSQELWDWRQRIIDGNVDRRNISIVVLDDQGNERIHWRCVRAWPSKLDPPDFNAKGNDVSMVALTITHEGVTQL